ncbi:MAG: PAS domain S-box protein [Sneathiella sp.]|nr:PAS domain S-box protein [Sneathiella sp.]
MHAIVQNVTEFWRTSARRQLLVIVAVLQIAVIAAIILHWPEQTTLQVAIAILVISFAAMLLTYLISKRSAKKMHSLLDAIKVFENTNYREPIPEGKDIEYNQLVAAFNLLADRFKAREEELFEQRDLLEEIVLERTRDLVREVREREATEKQVKLILDSAAEGIITADKIGTITSFNPAAEEMFGISAEEAIGQNLKILMPHDIARKHDGYLETYLRTGNAHIIGDNGREVTAQRSNGETFVAELAISEFRSGDTQFFTGIVRDMSIRKQAERELRDALERLQLTQNELVEAEKMASLGGLVAGVAHEINTPVGVGLTAITALEEKAKQFERRYQDGSMRRSDLDKFLESVEKTSTIVVGNLHRASELIRSFKKVAVDQSSEDAREFYLLNYIDDVLFSLHPQLKKTRIKVEVEGDRDLKVDSYPGPLAQIITNLVMNSILHAFNPLDEGLIKISASVDEEMVTLIFKDDGKGMREEVKSKVFEPFFTTARSGGGSGLGMHIVYNQITQTMGGTAKCISELGEGTQFVFTFPVVRGSRNEPK